MGSDNGTGPELQPGRAAGCIPAGTGPAACLRLNRATGALATTALVLVVAVVVAREARQRTEKGAKPNAAPAKKYPVTIRKPAGPPTVKTGLTDYHGNPVSVSCGTCHATRPANAEARLGVDLPSFHQGFKGNHGSLACIACHNPSDGYQTLRLADGRSVPYSEVMQLCAQCHGPQYRDYQRGAHGGMTGYWDLSRGPRARNNCIDCHDPHTPRYPAVRPAPGPNDRFLHDARKGAAHE